MIVSQELLSGIKSTELEIFRHFIHICDTLKLRYYVLGGTLLGAVRHKGFIPWDDDIDVGMPRADYEIFLQRAQELLPEGLFLQTWQTDPAYPANFAKIRNSNTTFIETSIAHLDMNHGIYIDIFPLDYYPGQAAQQKRLARLNSVLVVRISSAFQSSEPVSVKRKFLRGLSAILFPTVRSALRKREALFRREGPGPLVVNHCGAWGRKEIVPADWYGSGAQLEFEGICVNAPEQYDKWLTQVYGDYMTPPPVEKQKTHHEADAIDPEKSYTCYLQRNERVGQSI